MSTLLQCCTQQTVTLNPPSLHNADKEIQATLPNGDTWRCLGPSIPARSVILAIAGHPGGSIRKQNSNVNLIATIL
eukprot:jgi/Chrzof1/2117/Cz11g03070.t1